MSTLSPRTPAPASSSPTFLGHPPGLFLLFLVEMWERFSYYGMRALLVLYLSSPTTGMLKKPPGAPEGFNPGPGWLDSEAATLYGWYTGLAYLFPVIGGIFADKLIGTHRSMLVGGVLIMLGHIALAASGLHALSQSDLGISIFIFGLALIILGTGHFKPSVSVMVGQLYAPDDPRRDSAFSIFYMGINLGAFLCAFVCGTLGEQVGWHWGFGSAAVGMFLGLAFYTIGRPFLLKNIGNPPPGVANFSLLFLAAGILLSAAFALLFHVGALRNFEKLFPPAVLIVLALIVLSLAIWFLAVQRPQDRGPVATIFIFLFFNSFFWMAFEQAGSSMTLFTDRYTDCSIRLPSAFVSFWDANSSPVIVGYSLAGLILVSLGLWWIVRFNRSKKYLRASASIIGLLVGLACLSAAILKPLNHWPSAAHFDLIPTTWFQSVNPALIILFAPFFAGLWSWLGRRRLNPSQPVKISMGLFLLGLGFLVLVLGATTIKINAATEPATVIKQAAIFYLLGAYFLHTMGELCISPTGLSYVTKAAPVRFVSLLMGISFVSNFIANLAGGLVAGTVQSLEKGARQLPWKLAPDSGSIQADFFLLFVVSSFAAGLLILLLTPLLKPLMRLDQK